MAQGSSGQSKTTRLVTVSVNLPDVFVEALDELVRNGFYLNRAEAIRFAVRDLIMREMRYIAYRQNWRENGPRE